LGSPGRETPKSIVKVIHHWRSPLGHVVKELIVKGKSKAKAIILKLWYKYNNCKYLGGTVVVNEEKNTQNC